MESSALGDDAGEPGSSPGRPGRPAPPTAQIATPLARLATRLLQTPLAMVSVLDGERQRIHGSIGLPEPWASAGELPLDHSFCERVMAARAPVAIDDARRDPLLRERPAIREVGMVSYLGVPLLSAAGEAVGAFCAADWQPRSWSPEDVEALGDIAASFLAGFDLYGALQATEQDRRHFQQLLEGLDVIVWESDPLARHFSYVGGRAQEILGYPPARWLQEPEFWAKRLHPEDRARVVELCRRIAAEGRDHEMEYRAVAADGRVVWIYDIVRAVRGPADRAEGLRGLMVDVTARKQTEETLRQSEQVLHAVVEGIPDRIFLKSPEGRYLLANTAAASRFGLTPQQMVGRLDRELLPSGEFGRHRAMDQRILGSGASETFEEEGPGPGGSPRIYLTTKSLYRGPDGTPAILGISRDITRLVAHEARLRSLAAALENLPQGVAIFGDEQRGVVYTNPAFATVLGIAPGDEHRHARELLGTTEGAEATRMEIARSLAEAGEWTGRIWFRRADDGRTVPLDATVFLVGGPDDQDLYLVIVHDATREIEAERRLRRAERLASMGTLISGVAHELNNPLSSILSFAQLLLMDARPEEERRDLEIIQREAERMARIVAGLRTIARQTQEEQSERTLVDLNEVARHIVQSRRYALETRNVEVREELAPGLPPVLASRGQIEQVLLNLMVNAEQALAEQPGARRLVVRTHGSASRVALYVEDNGPGIPTEHLDRIFDPFFTTKEPGEGTGLGLALVHSIIDEHGGEVHVDSHPGHGTTFRIELPGAPGAPAAGEAPPGADTAPRPLRVVVVDDEEGIRRVLTRFLRRRGHEVVEATDGAAALRLLREAGPTGGYDVILSDLRMPGLAGEELLARLSSDYQRRVIFMTGDAASQQAARALSGVDSPVLLKPLSLPEVARLVEQFAERLRTGS